VKEVGLGMPDDPDGRVNRRELFVAGEFDADDAAGRFAQQEAVAVPDGHDGTFARASAELADFVRIHMVDVFQTGRVEGVSGRPCGDLDAMGGFQFEMRADEHPFGAVMRQDVVDLTETNAAPRFYVSTDAFPDGGLANDIYRTKKLVMRRIPAAGVRWTMGSPSTEAGTGRSTDGRENQHEVTLTEDFYLGIYTVSQGQQVEAIGSNTAYPSHRTNDLMVINNTNYIQLRGAASEADWPTHGHHVADASVLGKWRAKTGIDFDLPTSAQWEYACRAGCGNTYFFGVDLTTAAALLPSLNAYAWFGGANGNSKNNIQLIGQKTPNPWGLYDMYGNIWEACLDWLTYSYADHETDPKGANSDTVHTGRIYRGGAAGSGAHSCRSACVNWYAPNSNTANGQAASWAIGYRLACPASLVWAE